MKSQHGKPASALGTIICKKCGSLFHRDCKPKKKKKPVQKPDGGKDVQND